MRRFFRTVILLLDGGLLILFLVGYLARYGHPRSGWWAELIAIGLPFVNEIIKKIKLKEKNNFSINNFLNLRKIFLNSVESNIFLELRTGSKELLYFLKKNNVKCYLCSVRSNKKTIYHFLKKNNLLQYFSGILLPKDLKINIDNSNHSNRILIKTSLIRKITKKINSNDIVYVGDSSEDIISAKRLFIKFVLFKSFYLRNDDVTLSKVTNMKILKNYLIDFFQL